MSGTAEPPQSPRLHSHPTARGHLARFLLLQLRTVPLLAQSGWAEVKDRAKHSAVHTAAS